MPRWMTDKVCYACGGKYETDGELHWCIDEKCRRYAITVYIIKKECIDSGYKWVACHKVKGE